MKTVLAIALVAISFFVAGPAAAHITITSPAPLQDYYVPDAGDIQGFALHGDDFHVYEEDNGCAGLQEEANDAACPVGTPADTILVDL